MSSVKPSELGDLIPCEVCFLEIPVSEAKSEEATEYVVYFCGLDCYDRWKKQPENEKKSLVAHGVQATVWLSADGQPSSGASSN